MRTLLVLGLISTVSGQLVRPPAQSVSPVKPPVAAQMAHLPLSFERDGDRYIARGQGYWIGLEKAKATLAFASGESRKAISVEFAGSHPGDAAPGPKLPGQINVIRGNDPRQWKLGLPTYERVSWPSVYPGIDVVYYGNQQELEFDFVVKPGADPGAIRMKVLGADKLALDAAGSIQLGDAAGGIRIGLPQIYQVIEGAKTGVPGRLFSKDQMKLPFGSIRGIGRTSW